MQSAFPFTFSDEEAVEYPSRRKQSKIKYKYRFKSKWSISTCFWIFCFTDLSQTSSSIVSIIRIKTFFVISLSSKTRDGQVDGRFSSE